MISLKQFIEFVDQHPNEWLPTLGGRKTFKVGHLRSTSFRFTLESGKHRHESHQWVEESIEIFNQTGSLKASNYSKSQNTSYVLAIFGQIIAENELFENQSKNIPTDEKEILSASSPTEQEQLRKSRLGQGKYRDDLIKLRKKCYVSGINKLEFLRASHIKPWSESNNIERLDPHNGLLLLPNYDLLFDKGYISFEDDGRIMISAKLQPAIATSFSIDMSFKGIDLGSATKVYLAYHRQNKFIP